MWEMTTVIYLLRIFTQVCLGPRALFFPATSMCDMITSHSLAWHYPEEKSQNKHVLAWQLAELCGNVAKD